VATSNAIAATTCAILGLLEDAARADFGEVKFTFAPIHPFDYTREDKGPADGVTLCLYRVATNATLRNLPPRTAPDGTRYRPSLPLDLHYLLTPWAANVEVQQRLLGWAMRQLENNTVLPAGLLNKYLREDQVFRPDETVELVADTLSFADYTGLWDKLKPRMQASATYVARMVLIDSDVELREGRHVQTRVFELAKVTS